MKKQYWDEFYDTILDCDTLGLFHETAHPYFGKLLIRRGEKHWPEWVRDSFKRFKLIFTAAFFERARSNAVILSAIKKLAGMYFICKQEKVSFPNQVKFNENSWMIHGKEDFGKIFWERSECVHIIYKRSRMALVNGKIKPCSL